MAKSDMAMVAVVAISEPARGQVEAGAAGAGRPGQHDSPPRDVRSRRLNAERQAEQVEGPVAEGGPDHVQDIAAMQMKGGEVRHRRADDSVCGYDFWTMNSV